MIAFLKHQNFFHHIFLFNFIDNFQAFNDFSKNSMLTVQMRGGAVCDEKLASVGSGTCVGHRKNSGAVMPTFQCTFIIKFISGAPGSGSLRTTALDHKIGNYTMEIKSVIIPFFDQRNHVGHRVWSIIFKHFNCHIAAIGLDLKLRKSVRNFCFTHCNFLFVC